MLRFLRIRRLAVIDTVEVEFDPGLNVLTGETGAGKSILVEAVGLLVGGRASGDLVRTGEETASIEAIFENSGEELLIRREITAQGRSRAFINGELTTAGALKDLSARLIELHGQHEHQTLLDPSTHLSVLDAFGAHDRLGSAVAEAFGSLQAAAAAWEDARKLAADRSARHELANFQLSEIDRADPRLGEDDELTATRQVLVSAERVVGLCEESYAALYDRDDAVLSALGAIWKRVTELAALDPRFQPYLDARDGIKPQLEDLAQFLRHYADSIEASPANLQKVEERLAVLDRLKRKYGPTLPEVVATRNRLKEEVDGVEHSAERVAALDAARVEARRSYLAAAKALSFARKTAAKSLASALEQVLADLAMERTRVELRFGDELPESAWTAFGVDQAEFFVSPNVGEELRPLARIVSGGELSRVMLALKSLMATARHGFSAAADRPASSAAPGLIFDEVDAGIGGRVADIVGRKLRGLGSAFQVLCITHLPQIAAYADTHFVIEKSVEKGRTRTSVTRLTEHARVEEIGRMLGGTEVSDSVRTSAREMLADRRAKAKGEMKPKGESESRTGRASR